MLARKLAKTDVWYITKKQNNERFYLEGIDQNVTTWTIFRFKAIQITAEKDANRFINKFMNRRKDVSLFRGAPEDWGE